MKKNTARLSDQVADQIKHLIKEKKLQSGDRLPSERALSEQLKISRSPIREAIRMLNSLGLLITKRGGGTYVQSEVHNWPSQVITPLAGLLHDDIQYRYDVLEARQALEKSTASLAAKRATPKDKQHIQYCFDTLVKHQVSGDKTMSARADAQFHLAIAEASHNAVLLQVMRGLFQVVLSTVTESRRAMFHYKDEETIRLLTHQHQAIMHAIFNADPEEAENLIDEHLHYVHDNLRSYEEDQARKERVQRLSIAKHLL